MPSASNRKFRRGKLYDTQEGGNLGGVSRPKNTCRAEPTCSRPMKVITSPAYLLKLYLLAVINVPVELQFFFVFRVIGNRNCSRKYGVYNITRNLSTLDPS